MSKHTPGPWFARTEVTPRIESSGKLITMLDDFFGDSLPMDQENVANAHLIAAAPDLLAALEAFMDEANTKDVRQMARAAIAKAKGEE